MTVRNYRLLIVVSFALLGLAVALSSLAGATLPPELRAYAERSRRLPAGSRGVVMATASLAYLLSVAVSAVGLYRFRSWARPLAMTLTVLTIGLIPVLGPIVESAWTRALVEASWLLWGMILALSYWSNLAERFTHGRPAA